MLCTDLLPADSPAALHRLSPAELVHWNWNEERQEDIPLSSLVNNLSAPSSKMASLSPVLSNFKQSSELDLKGLVQLSGEGICRGGCGALAWTALQGCPLGLKGIFLRRWERLSGWGWWSELGRSSPAVCSVEGHTTIRWLEGSGVHCSGLWVFDERADVGDSLGIMLGCGGGRDGEWLGLRGWAEHMSHHLWRSDADHRHAGLRERQPVRHRVRGWSLSVEGGLARGQHWHGGGQRGHEGHRGNRGSRRHRHRHGGSERLVGRRRCCHVWIRLRGTDRLGNFF